MENKNLDRLLELVEDKRNILVTGQAGVGKTYLLNQLRDELDKNGVNYELAASTGIAAINIEGTTVHRMFGLGIASSIDDYKQRLNNKIIHFPMVRKAHQRIQQAEVIIIDEISMISAKTFELLHHVCREAMGSNDPFGGKQIILFGDFLQLPPINDDFAFETDLWNYAAFETLNLTKVYRQQNEEFIKVLSKIRVGDVDEEVSDFLKGRIVNNIDTENITKLYGNNKSVDKENSRLLNKLEGESETYVAEMGSNKAIARKMITPEELTLKVGAKVMSTANHDELDYVNGSIGTVTEINPKYVMVDFDNGAEEKITYHTWEEHDGEKVVGKFKQIPLKLAYAITIHKSQGQTIDGELCIDLGGIFEEGQLYVSLSRVRDPNKLYLVNPKSNIIKTNQKAKEFYDNNSSITNEE